MNQEEKEVTVNHLGWTDEQLGKLVRTIADRIRDKEGREACFATIGIELILASMAMNDTDGIEIALEGMTLGDQKAGNYDLVIAKRGHNEKKGKLDAEQLLDLIHEGINWTKRYAYSSQSFSIFDGVNFQVQICVTRDSSDYLEKSTANILKDL